MGRTTARPIEGEVTDADRERFWVKTRSIVRGRHKGCLEWTAAKCQAPTGDWYGKFRFRGRTLQAQRFALYLVLGHDPGPSVDHLCYNTLCVAPEHLRGGSIEDNNSTRRCVISEFCLKGHERTEENIYVNPTTGCRVCKMCRRARDTKRGSARYAKEKLLNTHTSEMRDFSREPKINLEIANEIRARYVVGDTSQRKLAREYKISQPLVGMIVRGEIWR